LKNKAKSNFSKKITLSIMIRFFITLAIYVAIIVLGFVTAETFLRQFIWQPTPLFDFLRVIERNAQLILIFGGLGGFAVIFVFYWRKTLGFIDAIVDASEVLVEESDDLIVLPDELRQIELRMNRAKQDVLRSSREAKEAEQRKNDMVMYLAHDIKTPLTSVIGYLSLLDEAPDMPVEQKARYVNITLTKAYRLERLIDEFFEITRYNFQAIVLTKESIDLCYMLTQMTDEFYPQLSAKGKQITLDVPEDLTIDGDRDKLARTFNNILKNAVAYSAEGSTIHITATVVGDVVYIAFKNPGSIPKDKLASIFEKFYRLDAARSSDTGGAGLGLAIAKEIIAEHGGKIYADSDDGHTIFTVELPAISTAAILK